MSENDEKVTFSDAQTAVRLIVKKMSVHLPLQFFLNMKPSMLILFFLKQREFLKKKEPVIESLIQNVCSVCSIVAKGFLSHKKTMDGTVQIKSHREITPGWKPVLTYHVDYVTKQQADSVASIAGVFAIVDLIFRGRINVLESSKNYIISELIVEHQFYDVIREFEPLVSLSLGNFLKIRTGFGEIENK